jgi:hypothetical protein
MFKDSKGTKHSCFAFQVKNIDEGIWKENSEDNIWTQERADVTRGWRKLHNEELHNLYNSRDRLISQLPDTQTSRILI